MHRATRFLVLILFFLVVVQDTKAQKNQTDSSKTRRLNPKTAAIYSAICPGLGQIYNHKIWKAVIVYAGFAGISYGFVFNQRELNSYQKAVDVRFDTLASTVDTKYPDLYDATVVSYRNYHRRNRDICILALVGFYALNIIDANVDAHLQEFSINKDLSVKWRPIFNIWASQGPRTGLNLTFTF